MISIEPNECLQDEKVLLTLKQFQPFQNVTISCHVKDSKGKKFFSYAYYRINQYGELDLSRDPSLGGHYVDVFQMGLISSLAPEPKEHKYLRLFKKDVLEPNKIIFHVYDNHLTSAELLNDEINKLCIAVHYRHFMAPDVKRIPIKIGRVRGTIFIPPGNGPFPGVIDMFGTAGGCLEFRSAQLASRGVVSLALAYFGYDDLPADPIIFDLSYFQEAVHVLLSFEEVCKPGVGAIGVSKAGDLALSMAVYIPEVTLAICISGCNANLVMPLIVNDKVIPALMHDITHVEVFDDGSVNCIGLNHCPQDYPESIIPLQKTNASIMFIVGEDDKNLDSEGYSRQAMKLMQKHGKQNYKALYYKDAGHLIEPPYSAFCDKSYHKILNMVLNWGGSLEAHSYAQEDSWKEMLRYIKENLQTVTQSKL